MALSADKERFVEKEGKLIAMPLATGAHVYKGGIVINDSGLLKPASAIAGATAAGIAYEEADQANGDSVARVMRKGVFELKGSGFSQADVGSSVYASDDETVSTTQGANEVCVGEIVEFIDSETVYVDIDRV